MHDVVAAARRLAPQIRAASDQIEADRQLPSELARAMSEAQLFTLLTPAAYGGAQVEPMTAMRAVEQVGMADGSAGWLTVNSSYEAALLGWLSGEAIEGMRRVMADPDRQFQMAGAIQPQGTAYAVEGGYQVSGHWDFVSGIAHANWVTAGVSLLDGPDGERLTDDQGEPATRVTFIAREQGEIVDAWDTMGMRGTGSHDFVVEDEFVPAERTMRPDEPSRFPGPRYRMPFVGTWGWCSHGANGLGIARGALNDLTGLAQHGASKVTPALLRDRPQVQRAVAEAEAIVRAARAFLFEAVEAAWTAACAEDPEAERTNWEARLALTHAVYEAVRAVGLLYDAVGTPAIFRALRLERAFRDLNVAKHHVAASPRHYETVGAVLLGSREP